MKYKVYSKAGKEELAGGDYWRDSDFSEHLKLTQSQTLYHYFTNCFKPPCKVLEAGCGLGRWVIELSQKRYNVTGIEISKEAIDLIQQNYSCENLQLVHGDIFNMPFDSNSYDVVLSLGVLEHFEKREILDKAIREHVRVLRNDGIFIVTVPYLSLLRLLIHMPYTKILTCVRRLKFKEQFFTEYRYSYNEFKRILEANGLLIMETIWDDLLSPFSFGMTVDYPLKRITAAKEIEQYKMNKNAARVYRVIWKVNPGLVSGGIGFICRKIS